MAETGARLVSFSLGADRLEKCYRGYQLCGRRGGGSKSQCQALHIYKHAKSDTGAETRCFIQHCAYPTTAVAYIRSWAIRNTTGPAHLLALLESLLLCRDSLV